MCPRRWGVPERCIKYASDWSYAAIVADEFYTDKDMMLKIPQD
jgi:hypothetical protein